MKIEVDETRCISAGNCVFASIELFDQRDEDGVVVVLDDRPESESLQAAARRAAAVCPSNVITILD
ncbi:ferredoxin [Nocardioides marmoriginsengisoli]|uniref:Ferredoxin n=1 Tax=Nocardioides marmoriginsengisoli TaxID=661483 RepID=A0A3N0CIL7_9ACTN|nr:ferredoxin [Nocardioides marmoriginsengisoli]RNL62856.1 ferredoxin [Nocardioides marmoriginsengisoli]